jgi:hypothetical protein
MTSVTSSSLSGNGTLDGLLLRAVRPEQPYGPSCFRGVLRFPVYLFLPVTCGITATSTPSLSLLVPSGSLAICSSVSIVDLLDSVSPHSHSLVHTQIHTSGGGNYWGGRGSPYPGLLAPLSFCAWEGVDPCTVPTF